MKEKHLMVNYYILDEVLDKIKEAIGIIKFDDTKILIDSDDKLLYNITLKNVMMIKRCVIKDNAKFGIQIFLEEALYNE